MEECASQVHGESGERKTRRWTDTYERWENWQDPDDAARKREEEEKRLKNFRENNMSCAHDRSAERTLMEMSIEDKLRTCRGFRQKGNLFHQEGQYRRAALQYRQALIHYDFCFPEEEIEQQELDAIRQACVLNSAACFLACRELDQALDCCYQALREEPDNVKALYRRAVIYRLRDQFKEASVDLGKALAQRPNDVMLRKESAVLKSKIASYRERRKAMGEQIFRKGQEGNAADEALPLSEGTGSLSDGENDADDVWDPSENLRQAAGKGLGGGYTVAGVVPVGASDGDGVGLGEEEGRRRHDLSLPVCVDLSELEAFAGCAWPCEEQAKHLL